jgi:hypothetical protein
MKVKDLLQYIILLLNSFLECSKFLEADSQSADPDCPVLFTLCRLIHFFHTIFYWQESRLSPHHRTTDQQPFLRPIPAIHKMPFISFEGSWLTQKFFTHDWPMTLALHLILSQFHLKLIINSFTTQWHPTVAMLIPLSNLPNTYTFSNREITFLFISPYLSPFPAIIKTWGQKLVLKTVKSTEHIPYHALSRQLLNNTGPQMRSLVYYSLLLHKCDYEEGV